MYKFRKFQVTNFVTFLITQIRHTHCLLCYYDTRYRQNEGDEYQYMAEMMGEMDIAFPNLGIYLTNVPKTIMVGNFGIAIYGIVVACGMLLGLAMAVYVLVSFINRHAVAGWASTMMSIWLLGGLQLMALGMIGEYVGKIYMETKRRPKFILEEHLR